MTTRACSREALGRCRGFGSPPSAPTSCVATLDGRPHPDVVAAAASAACWSPPWTRSRCAWSRTATCQRADCERAAAVLTDLLG